MLLTFIAFGLKCLCIITPGKIMGRSFAFTGLSILWTYACGVLQRTRTCMAAARVSSSGRDDFYHYYSSGPEEDDDDDNEIPKPSRSGGSSSFLSCCYVEPFTPCQLRFAVLLFLDGWLMPLATVCMAVVVFRRLRVIACMQNSSSSSGAANACEMREMMVVKNRVENGSMRAKKKALSSSTSSSKASSSARSASRHKDDVLNSEWGDIQPSTSEPANVARKRNNSSSGTNERPVFVPSLDVGSAIAQNFLSDHHPGMATQIAAQINSSEEISSSKDDVMAMFRMAQQQAAAAAAAAVAGSSHPQIQAFRDAAAAANGRGERLGEML